MALNFIKTKKTEAEETKVFRDVPVRETTADYGLTYDEVRERFENGLLNNAVESPMKSEKQIVKDNCLTFFNLVFAVLAVCLILTGNFTDVTFLGIVIANTAIGIYQEIRSKRTVDKLTLMTVRKLKVIREGEETEIPTDELCRDEVVEFSAGDQIPADATVLSGSLQANESLITGEADAIEKFPGDSLLSGSFAVAGKCRARLTRVGNESYASRLTIEAKANTGKSQSEMMRSLDKLIRIIGIVLIPLGILSFIKNYTYFSGLPEYGQSFGAIKETVRSTVASLIGMIPEGLYLLTSVALAVSVVRLASKRVLTQDLNCIETLARVDYLCVDKTGTITENVMEAVEPVLLDAGETDAETVLSILSAFYNVQDADNDTSRALSAKFKGNLKLPYKASVPFTSATKWAAVSFMNGRSFAVGAPEFIMGDRYSEIEHSASSLTSEGYRVLLLAEYIGEIIPGSSLDCENVIPIAFLPILNRIRPEAPETFRYFREQGVNVIVISGDNPKSVSEVARRAGIPRSERWIDAKTLKSEADYTEAVKKYTVFGRVTPDQKRKLIRALKSLGHTVAMTGDGVNDVLALKDSDCGIAMASGSEAACHVAKLVLLDSDFSALPSVVAEGRRVINNIERSASLFLVKNIFSFGLTVILLFFSGMPYPLVPIQLSLISCMTIGVPSFFLALEPNKDLVKGKFMRNVLARALPGGFTNILMVFLLELFYLAFGENVISIDRLRTMCALIMSVIGMLILIRTAKPMNWQRLTLTVAMGLGIAGSFIFLGDFFSFAALDFRTGLIISVLLLLCIYNMKYVLYGFEKIYYYGKKIINALRSEK